MKRIFCSVLVFVSINAFANSNYDSSRIIIKVKNGFLENQVQSAKRVKHLFKDYFYVTTENFNQTLDELKNNSNIAKIEKNFKSEKRELAREGNITFNRSLTASNFNDPYVTRLWGFDLSQGAGTSIEEAYSEIQAENKQDIIVAVVDTGVDYNHRDIADNMWINTGETPNNGIDDDQNGYVDDVYGISTLERDSDGNATGNPMDKHFHGTHVAGTIGAVQNNNLGIPGIASNAKIMAVRTVPSSGDETDIDVVESFIYAAEHGAKLINCSFGKRLNEGGMIVSEAIDHIAELHGTLVIAAAGNSNADIDKYFAYPASFQNESLLVVAATDSWNKRSYFSNYGLSNVDLGAPGSGVYSLAPGNSYKSLSGTSMASPWTTGVAAEVLSQFPDLTPTELKKVLMDSITDNSSLSGKTVTGGKIDLYSALLEASAL